MTDVVIGKPAAQRASPARILMASMVGNAIELYDFFIYAAAASLVFGPLFFPAASPSAQLLAAYASFGIAFIARPLGGVVFGHFGDRIGRKATLVAALLLMGGSTVAIGLLPTYATIGWWAALLLCLMRLFQGFGLGGEWGGAALLAVENAPPGYRGRYGMFTPLGAPIGFFAANGFFLVLGAFLTQEEFVAWGWRIPFVASAVLVIVGLWIRLRLTETPVFQAALKAAPPPKIPVLDLVRLYPRQLIAGTFTVVASFAIFYIITVFTLGYGINNLGFARSDFLILQLGAIVFMAIGTVWAGFWADRTSPWRVVTIGTVGAMIVGVVFTPMLAHGTSLSIWAVMSFALLVMGLMHGPSGSFLPSLFPPQVRYTGVSISFNLGGIIGGAGAPVIAQSLANSGGLWLVGLYIFAAGLISFVAMLSLRGRQFDD